MPTIKQGEVKIIKFTVKSGGVVLDVSSATCTFTIKLTKSGNALVTKTDADFDKTDAAVGILKVTLTTANTNQNPNMYIGELKTVISATNTDKSADIEIEIIEAVN